MKQKLFGAASAVAFILFGASCSNQEQSEFNFDSVTQEVVISAKVTYDAGVEVDPSNPKGYKIVNAKPAVGRKVFIEVPYSEFANPTAAASAAVKIFETVTDEDGMFTITLPTRSEGIDATIRLEEFTAIHNEYVKMENGKPVFKSKLWTYQTPQVAPGAANPLAVNLKPGAFKFPDNNDISYAGAPIDEDQFDESVTITGNVNLAYETGFRKGAFKSASNATIEFEIIYNYNDPVAQQVKMKFGSTTDAQGNYSIVLPITSLANGFRISSIKVLGIGEQSFTHWVNDSVREVVSGAYQTNNNTIRGVAMTFNNIVDGITYDLGTKNLTFKPYYNQGITAIPEPENWSDDLIGWSAGRDDLGFDETFDKTVSISGNIHMPYLKAYGEGAYKSTKQTIILTGPATTPYASGLVVITEADGSFNVDLPVADENSIDFTVKLEKQDQPFEFIGSKKSVTLYNGKYGPAAANIVQIKAEGTEWYELGDFYFQYVPGSDKPDEWKDELIGWYKDPTYNKINPEKKIRGQFLYAVENNYGIGTYEPKPFLVTISATQTIAGTPVVRKFVVKPDAQGKIEFDLPLKDELDQPVIDVADGNYPTNEYIHYYMDANKQVLSKKLTDNNDDENLRGYTLYKKVYDKKDPEWNEKIGTRYFKFAQTTPIGGNYLPSTFHKNLAGWLIAVTDDNLQYQESITADGQALRAVETSFLTGEFENAKKEIVAVTIAGLGNVEVLTNNNGKFSFDVPLKNVGDEPGLTPVVGGYDVDNFVHYVAPGKTKTIAGHYTGTKVKEDDTPWNKVGTIYYTFEPTDEEKAALPAWDGWDTYSKFIAGWAFEKGYKFKATVSGSAVMSYETAFRAGDYKPAENLPVKIKRNGKTYVAPIDKNGDFNIQVLNEFEDDDYAVTWMDPDINMQEITGKYEHFRKPNSEATMTVEGVYTVNNTINGSKNWNEKGKRYYIFAPDVDPMNWTTSIYGWDVPGVKDDTRLTIRGAVKKGDEGYKSNTAYEKWNAAAYSFVNVTVKVNGVNHTYKVVTDASGKFDVCVYCNKDDVPNEVTLSISPEKIHNDAFEHHDDKAKSTIRNIEGDYETAANVWLMDIPRESDSSKLYDLTSNKKHGAPFSAKMIFNPDDDPTNWTDFDWSSYTDNEQDNTK